MSLFPSKITLSAQRAQPAVEQVGGLTRVQFGRAEADLTPKAIEPTYRVCTGPIRYTGGGGEENVGVQSYTIDRSGVLGGSVMATMQTINGKRTVETRPGDPSSRTDAQTAARMGVLEAIGDGYYRDTGRTV